MKALPLARQFIAAGVDDWREALEQIRDDETDFTVDNMRIIHENEIDQIMREELASDTYMLGCFDSWFLADILCIDTEAVEDIQKADACDALGKMVLSGGHLGALQQAYASADGYGHHFSNYDGEEHQAGAYYVFRN